MKLSPVWLIVAALTLYVLYLTQCRQKQCPPPIAVLVDTQAIVEKFTVKQDTPEPKIIYTIKTVTEKVPGKPPAPVFVEVIKDREVPIRLSHDDTMAILKDYYARVHYEDSVETKYGKIRVHETVSRNRIEQRIWDVQLATPVVRLKPWSIYGGAGGYTAPGDLISAFHADLGYVNRKGQSFQISGMLQGNRWHKGFSFHQTIYSSKK